MIEIVNGKVFVEGKETVDPLLIGYAVLDAAENAVIDISSIKEKYLEYIKNKNFRKTQEREMLIDLMVSKNITNQIDLVKEAKKMFICQASCYNLFAFLKKTGIADFANTSFKTAV